MERMAGILVVEEAKRTIITKVRINYPIQVYNVYFSHFDEIKFFMVLTVLPWKL